MCTLHVECCLECKTVWEFKQERYRKKRRNVACCVCVCITQTAGRKRSGLFTNGWLEADVGRRRKCFGKKILRAQPSLSGQPIRRSRGWKKDSHWMEFSKRGRRRADVLGKLLNPSRTRSEGKSENICSFNWTVTKTCWSPAALAFFLSLSALEQTLLNCLCMTHVYVWNFTFQMNWRSSEYQLYALKKKNV